ncbi:MAG: isoaspartyl peptidase/L-asparaginase [Planctomycetaceae bacterium]|nr:MAG: isoaspartyl peptidase/L-asparaginase [Planctomycetaceae bacterium]
MKQMLTAMMLVGLLWLNRGEEANMGQVRADGLDTAQEVVLAVHGGAGYPRKEVPAELEQRMRDALAEALKAGKAKLDNGGSSLDAVEAAIRVLEDAPEFNAGKGAVFTRDGRNELDASIMDGANKRAGAVAGVQTIRNPISAARVVMERSKHVMFVGRGAEVFASQQGLELVDPSYFWTERRWRDIEAWWKREQEKNGGHGGTSHRGTSPLPYGTVGAVAVDAQGNLAAGTSTGGMTGKMPGRVGDSPIIGAGTYADNLGAAVSCTGHGEYFIRYAVAHEIVALVKYRGLNISQAAEEVIIRQLKPAGGEGAAIVLDRQGRIAACFNSEGLYRGWITRDGKVTVRLYQE